MFCIGGGASLTFRQDCELIGSAKDTLGVGIHVIGREAVIVTGVLELRRGQVQVPRYLGDEPTAPIRLNKDGELIEEPSVGQDCKTESRTLERKNASKMDI